MNHPHRTSQQSGDNSIDLQFLTQDEKEDDWLSDQFNKTPYLIYKYWLIWTCVIALGLELASILCQFRDLDTFQRIGLALLTPSCILLLLSCREMLLTMTKKKSEFAHKSLIKFEYSAAGTVLGAVFLGVSKFDFNGSFLFQASAMALLPISIVFNIFGGVSVLGVFKKNNSVGRLKDLQAKNQISKDFLNQNAVIMFELSKYDRLLSKCPYLAYKVWLKFVFVLEVVFFFLGIFNGILPAWKSQKIEKVLVDFYFIMICSWTAFCCYEMEVVLRTKMLERSRKVLFHLKISLFMWIIPLAAAVISSGKEFFTLKNLLTTLFIGSIPLITRIGAVNVNKIIEQRDQFAKASSYSGDLYL